MCGSLHPHHCGLSWPVMGIPFLNKQNKIKLCVLMPIHVNITGLRFRVMRRDGVILVYFRLTHLVGRLCYVGQVCLYLCTEIKQGKGDCMCNCLLCKCVACEMLRKESRWKPKPVHSLLLSISTKGTTRLNVPIRRTNRYQQYNIPSQHMYCGRVWNLMQAFDVIWRLEVVHPQPS